MTPGDAKDYLSTCEPPKLATNASELLVALMEPDNSMAEVAAAIEGQALIVGKLISLANSAWSNRSRP